MQSQQFFQNTSALPTPKDDNDAIYYTTGLPILVQKYNSDPRRHIPNQEIIESFALEKLSDKKLFLFTTEAEAMHYAHSLRSGVGFGARMKPLLDEITQPAVFQVSYLGKIPIIESAMTRKVITIPTNGYMVPQTKIDMDVRYYEVERADVLPLKAQLKLRDCYGDRIHTYPSYSYIDQAPQCTII